MSQVDSFLESLGTPDIPLTPMQKAEKFIKLKQLKDRVELEYNAIRADLLEETKKHGVVSLKTEQYTISRVNRKNLKITNTVAAIRSLEERNIPVETKVVIDEELMKPVLDEIKKSDDFIAGIEITSTEYVTVRINK